MHGKPFVRGWVTLTLAAAGIAPAAAAADGPPPAPAAASPAAPPPVTVLSAGDAVRYAIEHNPDLVTARAQRGIAAAGVTIADTYPFNPVLNSLVLYDHGPDVRNPVFNEHYVRVDVECRGQGRHRRAAAAAALTRAEWDVANQELTLSVRVARAAAAFLYRRDKLRVADESVRLQEETARDVARLADQGHLTRSDVLLARANTAEARSARGPAYNAAVAAWYDFRRALGAGDETLDLDGTLETALPEFREDELAAAALQRRPDLQSLAVAVREAEARYRLEVANRFGNPSVGPLFEYNEATDYFVGATFTLPIPVFNTRRGEIQQRRAEIDKANAAARALEYNVRQEVRAALRRLANAEAAANAFRTDVLPSLRESAEAVDKLFAAGDPGADAARAAEVRRRLLRARDLYLDALFELSQAKADLAAAVGDPTLALAPCLPPPAPAVNKP